MTRPTRFGRRVYTSAFFLPIPILIARTVADVDARRPSRPKCRARPPGEDALDATRLIAIYEPVCREVLLHDDRVCGILAKQSDPSDDGALAPCCRHEAKAAPLDEAGDARMRSDLQPAAASPDEDAIVSHQLNATARGRGGDEPGGKSALAGARSAKDQQPATVDRDGGGVHG